MDFYSLRLLMFLTLYAYMLVTKINIGNINIYKFTCPKICFFRFLWYNKYMYEYFYIIYYLEGYFMRLFIALILLVLFFASPKAFLSVLMALFVFGCICYFIMMIFFTIPLILSVIILCLIVAGVVAFLVRYFNE